LESEKRYLEAIAQCRRKDGTPADQFDEIAGHYAELLRLLGRDAEAEGLPEKLRQSLSDTGPSEDPPDADPDAAGAEVEVEAEPGVEVDAETEVGAENGPGND